VAQRSAGLITAGKIVLADCFFSRGAHTSLKAVNSRSSIFSKKTFTPRMAMAEAAREYRLTFLMA